MKRKLIALLQLGLGIGLVVLLLRGIDRNTLLVQFQIAAASVEKGTVYLPELPDGAAPASTEATPNTTRPVTRMSIVLPAVGCVSVSTPVRSRAGLRAG